VDFPDLVDFLDFPKLMNFAGLAQLTEKDGSYGPWRTPIYKLSKTSTVLNISVGQLGLAAWLCSLPAPAPLLSSQTWETEKSP